jgi:hypothetical protein
MPEQLVPSCSPAMAAMPLSDSKNEVRACSWHLSVQFCLESHHTSVHKVKDVDFFSFAVPQILSSFFDTQAMPVTGVLNSKKPIRLLTVQSIFQSLHPKDLSVRRMPIRLGHGNSFTAHNSFQQFLRKSTNLPQRV